MWISLFIIQLLLHFNGYKWQVKHEFNICAEENILDANLDFANFLQANPSQALYGSLRLGVGNIFSLSVDEIVFISDISQQHFSLHYVLITSIIWITSTEWYQLLLGMESCHSFLHCHLFVIQLLSGPQFRFYQRPRQKMAAVEQNITKYHLYTDQTGFD